MRRRLLEDFESEPDKLVRYSFVRRDEPTTDSVRRVWFERVLDSHQSQLRFVVRVEFELLITDDPHVRTRDNFHYSFNGVILQLINRRMSRCDGASYALDTERPVVIGEYRLAIQTLREVNELVRLLCPGDVQPGWWMT